LESGEKWGRDQETAKRNQLQHRTKKVSEEEKIKPGKRNSGGGPQKTRPSDAIVQIPGFRVEQGKGNRKRSKRKEGDVISLKRDRKRVRTTGGGFPHGDVCHPWGSTNCSREKGMEPMDGKRKTSSCLRWSGGKTESQLSVCRPRVIGEKTGDRKRAKKEGVEEIPRCTHPGRRTRSRKKNPANCGKGMTWVLRQGEKRLS